MNLPKLASSFGCIIDRNKNNFIAECSIGNAGYAEIAAEIVRRCNEYDELKARVAELEKQNAELSAKNPDTDRIDWLSEGGFALLLIGPDQTIREAIDANRKNGGAA